MIRVPMLALVVVAACGNPPKEAASPPPPPTTAPEPASTVAPSSPPLDLAGMDTAVNPGDDFFAYANGHWLATTEIPPDRASYGAIEIVEERTEKRVAALIQEAAAHAPAGSEARKVGDYYATFMDDATIESKGTAPLAPELAKLAAIKTRTDLARAIGDTLRADVDALNSTNFYTPNLIGVWIAQDLGAPQRYAAFLLQGGLGMPDRNYYIDAAPRMAELRTKYRAHIAAMLNLAAVADADASAGKIVELETRIAKTHATRVESEDATNGLHHWTRADFDRKAPGLDWHAVFDAAGLGAQADFAVWHPSAMTGIAALAKTTSIDTWKAYLVFHAIERAAPCLPKAFVDDQFAFYGNALAGTPVLRERWKRAVDQTSDALGEAVGKLYVTAYFPDSAKRRVAELVTSEVAAFGRRIEALVWMAPATKAKAKAKLAALRIGVGYPDKWRDYTKLAIVPGDALGNADRASRFEYARNLAKLGTPVDRDEWALTPQLVNSVNLPAMNALNFPAGWLQPPFFDPSRPEVMDYGAVGAVIGHEISHSFDDQGAKFDATGKLEDWWTAEDLAHFKQQAVALAAQYDAYRPFSDLAVNGTLTVSENIADVAGLATAYDAYRSSLGGHEAPVWNGLTGDQQFFASFAQAWRNKVREPALRKWILANEHAPDEYRADTVRNQDAWYAAFGVQPGAKLYLAPAARVRVW